MWRAIHQPKSKHQPSGIIIVWLGSDDKIHTQSIAIQYPLWGRDASMKQTIIHARTELLFHQMDCWGVKGQVLPMPMMTTGLTRAQARLAYLDELSLIPLPSSQLFISPIAVS